MPQMMPINWLFSLFLFISIFIIFMIFNYFIFNYKLNYSINKTNKIKMNKFYWKW